MDPIDRKPEPAVKISHPIDAMTYLEQEPLEAGADGAFDLGDPSPPPSPPRSRVKVADDKVKSADDGVKSADDGVKSADDGVKFAGDGLKSGDDGVNPADGEVNPADDGVNPADDGVNPADDGVSCADDGISCADDGVKSGVDGVMSDGDAVKSGDDGCPKADTPVADSAPPASREIEDDWEKIDVQPDEGGDQPLVSPGRSTDGALDEFKDAVETLRPQSSTDSLQADKPGASAAFVGGSSLQPVAVEVGAVGAAVAAGPSAAGKTSCIAAGLSNVRLPMVYKRSRARGRADGGEDSDGEEDFHDAYASATDLVKDAGKAREMKASGNEHYKSGDFEDAVDYYTMALHYCPEDDECVKDRAVYFANRAQGHLRLKEYNKVVEDCTAALELDPHYVKALLRRAQANEHLEKYDVALEDAKALVEIDPKLQASKESVTRLEKLQTEKNEKMKDEALGKLKELGNSLLGNFGLSMDNFKMQQDPDSGSYSINFER